MKNKILPIRLDPQLYQDLKLVAHHTNQSMAQIMRSSFKNSVQTQAKKIKKQQQPSLEQYAQNHTYQKKLRHPQLNDDQLLYQTD
jgi:predicted transcriptional regulator